MEHSRAEKTSCCCDGLLSLRGICHAWISNLTFNIRLCIRKRAHWAADPQRIHNVLSIRQKPDCFRHCETDIEARDFRYRLCQVTIVVWSGVQWFADWFLDCTELPHNTFSGQSGFHWLLDMCYCVLRAETSTALPKEDISSLNNEAHKFLHHYELFRCSSLDVHILEARGPSKSNIKHKWDLYELIFTYSLLLRSVWFSLSHFFFYLSYASAAVCSKVNIVQNITSCVLWDD